MPMTSSVTADRNVVDPTRLHLHNLLDISFSRDDGQDVIEGLTQASKSLPPKYFYDHIGSEIFEKIWYVSRAKMSFKAVHSLACCTLYFTILMCKIYFP